jgi:DNA-binding transcriptional MerR regulator
MMENGITLEELSERTGVEARTLRSWVSEGLLAPPFKTGRGAIYPASNADRALAVRALKAAHGLSMSEIGRRFMMATEDQIREWALEAGSVSTPRGSARDYLSSIQARATTQPSVRKSMDVKPPTFMEKLRFGRAATSSENPPSSGQNSNESTGDLRSIERLILQLERVLEAPAHRRSRGIIWTRISVTPDLELSVRGDLEPKERILFEQLADQFRAILTGRAKNE